MSLERTIHPVERSIYVATQPADFGNPLFSGKNSPPSPSHALTFCFRIGLSILAARLLSSKSTPSLARVRPQLL